MIKWMRAGGLAVRDPEILTQRYKSCCLYASEIEIGLGWSNIPIVWLIECWLWAVWDSRHEK
jgi:hypothetical protein